MDNFISVYSQLGKENLADLEAIYHPNVVFEDPAHRIEGWYALQDYFGQLYRNILHCEFTIHHYLTDDNQAFVQWTMSFAHPDIEKGKTRTVEGCTRLEFDGEKVIHHRDYFDLGEMVYEGVPLLGKVIRLIKTRLGQ
ncbi:transcriptional regulator [Photobacterium jeanii]|uniref:Transcriptional regulator n=1 Tax=Photobacterium jeanii TaxID=858640 RepID=A0A178K345_9GAMM|nr:transcriptional regulator [Photobacterium jeanii]